MATLRFGDLAARLPGRTSPRDGRAASLVLAAWLAWALWVVAHYFTVPETWVVLADGPTGDLAHAGPALVRAVRGLAGAAVVLAAAWGAGALVIRPFAEALGDRGERAVVQLALGCGALSHLLLALAFLGRFSRGPIAIVLTAGAAVSAVSLATAWRARRAPAIPRWSRFDLACVGCAGAALAFAFIGALAPEIEWDALWYHLWLPARWLSAGRAVDVVEEYVSLYPLTWELLYGAAMIAGGTVAAKLLHFACLPLLGVVTWRLTRILFPRASAVLAAALAMTPPLVIWEATTAYIDLALAWYVALAVHAVARWQASSDRRWLAVAGLLFGVAAAIKHLALVTLAIALAWILVIAFRSTRSVRRATAAAMLVGLLALAVASPWYVRAYVASGNPVFPDLYRVFGASPEARWSDGAERALGRFKARFGRERTPGTLARLPWDLTVHGAIYGGTIGPIFLILVPLSLLAGGRARWMAVSVAAYLAIWASPVSSFQMRFLVPIVPLLASLSAEGARRIPGAALAAVPLMVVNLPPFVRWHEADRRGWEGWLTHVMRETPLPVVVGMESERAYLERTVPSYRAWSFINRELPTGARVLTFSGGDHLYSARARLWSDAPAAYELTWGAVPGDERAVRERLAARGVTHVLFDRRQLDSGAIASLAVASDEMRRCCLDPIYEDNRFVLYAVR